MNFFSHHLFSQMLQTAYFPGQIIKPMVFELNGKYWQVPTLQTGEPVSDFLLPSQFIDFYEPVARDAAALMQGEAGLSPTIPSLSYLPRACHGLATVEAWQQQELQNRYEPAPMVQWGAIASWEEFAAQRKRIFVNTRRCRRKLEREVGQPSFSFQDERGDVLATAMAWKSKQYRATGEADAFANAQHVKLFETLAAQKRLQVSTMRLGDQLLAVHIGFVSQGRFSSWVAAYDSDYHCYAPGRQLLHYLLQESFELGHQEFDFLRGNEAYKWKYATHTRLIAELGHPDFSIRAKRQLKEALKVSLLDFFNAVPQAKTLAKTVALRM